jgi:hypothetical protein
MLVKIFRNQLNITKMKKKSLDQLFLGILLLSIFISCEKNNYTIENKLVIGELNYVRTAFIPLEMNPQNQQPLSANITMEGNGEISDMGVIHMVSTFKFDFATGKGSEFVTTYSGESSSDSFRASASSQLQPDGTIKVLEYLTNGTGKFEKIKGSGETIVVLSPDQSTGIGSVSWTLTY